MMADRSFRTDHAWLWPVLLGLAAPLLAPGGTCLFPKGARVHAELEAARSEWRFEAELAGGPESPVLVVRGLARG